MSETPLSVQSAFTVRDPFIAAAILSGAKIVENRTRAYPTGWIALHVGVSKYDAEKALKWAESKCESDAEFWAVSELYGSPTVHTGSICGLVHVSHCLPVGSCGDCKWAEGPICIVIDKVMPFNHAILSVKGQLGVWKLTEKDKVLIQDQVPHCAITITHAAERLPLHPDALRGIRDARRHLVFLSQMVHSNMDETSRAMALNLHERARKIFIEKCKTLGVDPNTIEAEMLHIEVPKGWAPAVLQQAGFSRGLAREQPKSASKRKRAA